MAAPNFIYISGMPDEYGVRLLKQMDAKIGVIQRFDTFTALVDGLKPEEKARTVVLLGTPHDRNPLTDYLPKVIEADLPMVPFSNDSRLNSWIKEFIQLEYPKSAHLLIDFGESPQQDLHRDVRHFLRTIEAKLAERGGSKEAPRS
jgi:hypothetical protein